MMCYVSNGWRCVTTHLETKSVPEPRMVESIKNTLDFGATVTLNNAVSKQESVETLKHSIGIKVSDHSLCPPSLLSRSSNLFIFH